jgi:hypothetical protein
MRLNSLAFRLFATAAAWTLVVLPLAGIIIYGLYRDDVQASFDGQLRKLVNAITVDSMAPGSAPEAPENLYEPLFEVTHSGWYWQITPLDKPDARKLVSPSLASAILPSPAIEKVVPDVSGARWMDVLGPKGEPLRVVEVIDTLGHEPNKPRYSILGSSRLQLSQPAYHSVGTGRTGSRSRDFVPSAVRPSAAAPDRTRSGRYSLR